MVSLQPMLSFSSLLNRSCLSFFQIFSQNRLKKVFIGRHLPVDVCTVTRLVANRSQLQLTLDYNAVRLFSELYTAKVNTVKRRI